MVWKKGGEGKEKRKSKKKEEQERVGKRRNTNPFPKNGTDDKGEKLG